MITNHCCNSMMIDSWQSIHYRINPIENASFFFVSFFFFFPESNFFRPIKIAWGFLNILIVFTLFRSCQKVTEKKKIFPFETVENILSQKISVGLQFKGLWFDDHIWIYILLFFWFVFNWFGSFFQTTGKKVIRTTLFLCCLFCIVHQKFRKNGLTPSF